MAWPKEETAPALTAPNELAAWDEEDDFAELDLEDAILELLLEELWALCDLADATIWEAERPELARERTLEGAIPSLATWRIS